MKKINLKGISEVLSEKELKNVMGGSSSTSCTGCSSGETCYHSTWGTIKCSINQSSGCGCH